MIPVDEMQPRAKAYMIIVKPEAFKAIEYSAWIDHMWQSYFYSKAEQVPSVIPEHDHRGFDLWLAGLVHQVQHAGPEGSAEYQAFKEPGSEAAQKPDNGGTIRDFISVKRLYCKQYPHLGGLPWQVFAQNALRLVPPPDVTAREILALTNLANTGKYEFMPDYK